MKVKSTRQYAIDIILNCCSCKYHERYYFDGQTLIERRKNLANYRSKARYHTQITRHEVEVEITYMAVYKPEVTK